MSVTSWCVGREYFFGMSVVFVMNEKWFSPIIDQMQLGDQGSLQNERSKQSLDTEECMLYSEGKGGEKNLNRGCSLHQKLLGP